MKIARLVLISLPLLLVACETQQPVEEASSEVVVKAPDIRMTNEPLVVIPGEQTELERIIADTLFEGLQALDDDRLMTPIDDNAHQRFQRVLAMDPGNAIALDGLNRIVIRYVELSAEALSLIHI